MLSFSHRSASCFEGEKAVSQTQLNSRPTCSLQVPANDVPTRISRRERYLIALGVDYLCRWRVAAADAEERGDADIETAAFYAAIEHVDDSVRRNLIGVGLTVEANEETATTTTTTLPPTAASSEHGEFDVVDAGTACHAECRMHDWSRDATQKQYFTIKNRAHVLVHFAHPCNGGQETVPISHASACDADKHGAAAAAVAAASGVKALPKPPSRQARDEMMLEMMRAVHNMRGRTDGTTVNTRVEDARMERAEAFAAERRAEERAVERVRGHTLAACTRLIERVRRLESTTGSASSDEHDVAYSDNDDDTWDDSTESSSTTKRNTNAAMDNDESSDTFSSSSEDDDDDDEWSEDPKRLLHSGKNRSVPKPLPKHPTYADIAARAAGSRYTILEVEGKPVVSPAVATKRKNNDKSSRTKKSKKHTNSDADQSPPSPPSTENDRNEAAETSATHQKATYQDENAENVDTSHDSDEKAAENDKAAAEREAEKKTEKEDEKQQEKSPKPKAVRQTTVEMMVPVCEADDTLAFFDELECPYLLQWAKEPKEGAKRRRKMHLFRKQVRESRGWLSTSKTNVYHLLATIEALPQ